MHIVSDLVDGGWDEVKTVMEGDALTLHTGAQQNTETIWFFKRSNITSRIAHMNNGKVFTRYEKKLADRLQLDQESGSLTICNISTSDSGVYEASVTIRLHVSERKIKVDVYGKLQPVNVSASACAVSEKKVQMLSLRLYFFKRYIFVPYLSLLHINTCTYLYILRTYQPPQ